MKKTAFVLSLMLALLSSILARDGFVDLVEANPEPANYEGWGINIISPQNKTYFSNPVNLTIEFTHHFASGDFRYSLDGEPWQYLYGKSAWYHYDCVKTTPRTIKLDLFDGSHNIVVKFRSNTIIFCANVTFTIDTVTPYISIALPENRTYNTGDISLDFAAYRLSDIKYNLDGKANVSVSGKTILEVPDGFHSLAYYGTTIDGITYVSETVNFAVDTGLPKIEVLSIENKTYFNSNLELNFTVSEPVVKMGYSLDGKRVVINGNLTLTGLFFGSHFVTVHCYDTVSGAYVFTSPIFFSIFPTAIVMASSVTVAVVCVGLGLLVYTIKRKQFQKHLNN